MEFVDFYYKTNTESAVADPIPTNGQGFRVFSLSYPMLAKTVSVAGVASPTGQSSNSLILTRGTDSPITITYAEGFPTISQLQSNINQAIVSAVATPDPLQLILVGDSQARWSNPDSEDWVINYQNEVTKKIITGVNTTITETVLAGANSSVFNPDPRLGLSSLEFAIANGQKLTIPASGKWLDHVVFYLPYQSNINFKDVREGRLSATYSSIRVHKDLYCPRDDMIRLSYL